MAVIERRKSRDGQPAFRVKIRLKGFAPQSATFDRVTDAKHWAQSTEAAIREGRYFKVPESKRKTFSELAERYIKDVLPRKPKSERLQARQLQWWAKELGHMVLADVSPSVIARARDKLATERMPWGETRSPSTVVRYLAVLSHALSVAMREWEWIDLNPMTRVAKPKEPRGRTRFLAQAERVRLLEECKRSPQQLLYPIVVLALSTGMRKGEIMNLRWEDVDLGRGKATLWETKNGERRVVPITGHALDCLTSLSKVRRIDTSLVFPGTGTGAKAKPIDFRKHWLEVLKRAQVPDFRFHDLRHSTASYLAMSGVTIAEVAAVLGHKTLQMAMRYSHHSEAHTSGIVKALDEKLFGAPHAQLESRF
jgi:integrase